MSPRGRTGIARRCLGELLLVGVSKSATAGLPKIALFGSTAMKGFPAIDDRAKDLAVSTPCRSPSTQFPARASWPSLRRQPEALVRGDSGAASRDSIEACAVREPSHRLTVAPVLRTDDPFRVDARALERAQQPAAGVIISDYSARRTGQPSAARLNAAFAAPPGLSASRSQRSTCNGASGEMRSTSPQRRIAHDVAHHEHRREWNR